MNSLFARWERTYQTAPKDVPLLAADPADPAPLRYTYRELYATVHCLSAYLLSKGLQRGDRVLILADAHPQTVALDLALHAVGIVSVTLSPHSGTATWLEAVRQTQPRMIFCSALGQYRSLHQPLIDHHPDIPVVVRTNPRDELFLNDRFTLLERVVDLGKVYWREHQEQLRLAKEAVRPDDPATILFYQDGPARRAPLQTAVLTHRNLLTALDGQLERLQATLGTSAATSARFLAVGSPACIHTRTTGLYLPLLRAVPLQLAHHLRRVLPLVRTTAPTHLVCPAQGLGLLMLQLIASHKHPERYAKALALLAERQALIQRGEKIKLGMRWRYDRARRALWMPLRKKLWTSVQYLLTESQALTPEIELFFTNFGLCLAAGCCRPETAGYCSLNDPTQPVFQSAGLPLAGVQLRTTGGGAEDGALSVRGPQVSPGAYNNPQGPAKAPAADPPLPLRGHLHDGRLYLATGGTGVYRAR